MKIFNYTLILFVTLALFSCHSSNSDNILPVIEINLSSSKTVPTEITGDRFEIIIELSDNEDLQSIHFEDPTGVKHVSEFLPILKAALDAKESDVLSGETKTVKIQLVDLSPVEPSKYTIICNVTDASGNLATKTAYFEIK
jgi:hypothetical protein